MKNKTRIFWLHSHTLFSTGGTRFIFEVTKMLSKSYSVELIVEKSSNEWKTKFEENSVKITEIGFLTSTNILYWLFFPIFVCTAYLKLRKQISNNDIIISSMFPFNFLGSMLSNKHIYYCFEPFAFFYDEPLMRQEGKIKYFLLKFLKFLYSWIDKLGVKKAQKLMAINPSVGNHIQLIYNTIPNAYTYLGVDTSHFKKLPLHKNNKVTFFHSTDYTILKGTQYLIPVLKYLKQFQSRFQIIISDSVTNSKLKRELQSTIRSFNMEEAIVFKNHVPYEDLPKYYSMSDAYLFLGSPESRGASAASLSVLEAQSCGLPVLRSIGNSDEIIDNFTGLLVDPRSKIDLATKIIFMIQNRNKMEKMSNNCIQHIKHKYTWNNVVKVFANSIESFV